MEWPLLAFVAFIAVFTIPANSLFDARLAERHHKSHAHEVANFYNDAEPVRKYSLNPAKAKHTDDQEDTKSGSRQSKQPAEIPKDGRAVRKAAKDAAKNAEQDLKKTITKTSEISPSGMIKEDFRQLMHNFMPGKHPEPSHGWPLIASVISVLWMLVYYWYIYQTDREDRLDRWENKKRSPRQEDPRIKDMKPDLILMFHHPSHPYGDKDSEISLSSVRKCMVREEKTAYLNRVENLMDAAGEDDNLMTKMLASSALQRLRQPKASQDKALEEAADAEEALEEASCVTLGKVRAALLQDICESLPKSGFEVFAFSSIDDDEIFVGVSVDDPDVIRDELIRAKVKLQLQPAVVEHLGVGQNPEERESSPPYIKYDAKLATNIMECRSPPMEGFVKDDPISNDRMFFKTFHGKREEGSIISGLERIRLIHRHISSHLNLDAAKEQGILKDWYPVHSRHWLAELNACWANLGLIKDITFVQPLMMIHNYFGSRIAFLFAWNGAYCKMLCALLPIAFMFEGLRAAGGFLSAPGTRDLSDQGSVMCFSIVLVIWSKVASNIWDREQEYYQVMWDLSTAPDFSVRPDFTGSLKPAPEDHKRMSLQYPRNMYLLRQAIAWTICLLFCSFNFMCIFLWISGFDGRMGMVSSICLAIMIQIFTLIFNVMVDALTKAENHKYQNDFYSSYLMKSFIFQFVNQFSAYFFIAVKQKHTDAGCPNNDCMALLKEQLSMTLCCLVAARIFQVALSSVKVTLIMWWEERTLRKALEGTGKEIPVRGYIEEQSKYDEFRIREQIEGMIQLVVALGYVLIFGTIAPIIIALCFLVFMVQFRSNAYLTTQSCRRPVPRRSAGLGQWQTIVKFLMGFGQVFSGFLLVEYGPSFQGTYLLTKLSGFLIYVASTFLIWELVSCVVKPTSSGATLLQTRREYVISKVLAANEEATIKSLYPATRTSSMSQAFSEAQYGKEIVAGEFDKVPHLAEADLHCDTAR